MANLGAFNPLLRDKAWFSPIALQEGWYEGELILTDPLIGASPPSTSPWGQFTPLLRPEAWFSTLALQQGWFEGSLDLTHPLITGTIPTGPSTPSAAGTGRVKLRSTAVGVARTASSARLRLRSKTIGAGCGSALGTVSVRAKAIPRAQIASASRLRIRAKAFGSTPPQLAAGKGRIRLRSQASGFAGRFGQGSGRVKLRSTAVGNTLIGVSVKGPTRKLVIGAAPDAQVLIGASRSMRIGSGSNSLEEV